MPVTSAIYSPFPGQCLVTADASDELEQSLALVRDISGQLGESEGMLQARVAELQDQLAESAAQRLQELDEKGRLANRLQSLLDLLPGGVIVIDGQGRVREANPVALDLLGAPLEGALWREVIARSFSPRSDDGHEISLKDGRRVSIATRSLNIEPGQLVLLTDLTETRRLIKSVHRYPQPCCMQAIWSRAVCRPSTSSGLPVV